MVPRKKKQTKNTGCKPFYKLPFGLSQLFTKRDELLITLFNYIF